MIRNAFLVIAMLVATLAVAEDKKPTTEPIVQVTLTNDDKVEETGKGATKPTEVSSEKELEKAIKDEATRKKIAKELDLKEQVLLIFTWQGSGGDKLDYSVAESFPEQVKFTYKMGNTDDIRSHVKLYVLRKNVKWSVK